MFLPVLIPTGSEYFKSCYRNDVNNEDCTKNYMKLFIMKQKIKPRSVGP